MKRADRKESMGVLRIKGTLQGVSLSRTEIDQYGHKSYCGYQCRNKKDFMRFILKHYWSKPTPPNGGDSF